MDKLALIVQHASELPGLIAEATAVINDLKAHDFTKLEADLGNALAAFKVALADLKAATGKAPSPVPPA